MHTEFSLLRGMVRISNLDHRFQTAAMTDTHNLFGAVRFTNQCLKHKIYPVLGCALQIGERRLYVYVQDQRGYSHLCQLLSRESHGCANLKSLYGLSDGLLALMDESSDPAWAPMLDDLFPGRWGVALSKHNPENGYSTPRELLELAAQLHRPLVASNVAYFASEEDHEAYEAMRCIELKNHLDSPDHVRTSPYHRLLDDAEWRKLFADAPHAVENTALWAQRCHFVLEHRKQRAPSTPQDRTVLEGMARTGLARRLSEIYNQAQYFKQLEYELGVIDQLELAGYFLTVADYVSWAKARHIPTSCRGSGAGSVVAWAVGITDIDPLRFGLVFERFLNPERVSMADFDIDFCQARRGEVIEYVCQKYGQDCVAHIGTFGTLQAKAILRDVGRVTGMRYTDVDNLCKLIPYHPLYPVNLQTARTTQPEIEQMIKKDSRIERLWRLSEKLEGLPRHVSTHAAGIVISDTKLETVTPLYADPGSHIKLTQFDMYGLEQVGFVKYDILGLNGLTMIQQVLDVLKNTGIQCDLEGIGLDDASVFAYLGTGNSYGIFQLDSIGIREILRQMQPKRFEDLIALNALYRPGPVEHIPQYIQNKTHPEKIQYLYPELRAILSETYGIIVYQEQVLQIARQIAGFSLGEADILRRAIGKKIESEMQKQRQSFIDRATALHADRNKAIALFALIEKFAQYGFVKAHATCYATVMYRMAYLKTHYRVYFICVGMSIDGENHHRLIQWKREADREGIVLLPPCVTCSDADFTVVGHDTIRYGLRAIKALGKSAAQTISDARPFRDVWDFARRSGVNKQALEGLIYAGALDIFGVPRTVLLAHIPELLNQPQTALFPPEFTQPADPARSMHNEHLQAVGIYIKSHPLANIPWQALGFAKCGESIPNNALIVGQTLHIDRKRMKNGNVYGILLISDPYGIAEVSVFSELWTEMQRVLRINDTVWCRIRTGRGHAAQEIERVETGGLPLRELRCTFDQPNPTGLEWLGTIPRGKTRLVIQMGDRRWDAGRGVRVTPEVLRKLREMKGVRWVCG
jgi:DNA polymerase-3 subunit alpha